MLWIGLGILAVLFLLLVIGLCKSAARGDDAAAVNEVRWREEARNR
jgi:hypothetical protein